MSFSILVSSGYMPRFKKYEKKKKKKLCQKFIQGDMVVKLLIHGKSKYDPEMTTQLRLP